MVLPCRCTVLDAVLQSDSSIANAVLQYEVALQHPENKAALEQAYDRWGLRSVLVHFQTNFRQKGKSNRYACCPVLKPRHS